MATYLIGDIHGCYQDLRKLLDTAGFSPETDTLYLAGDLVARGPDSLSTLRFVRDLGSSARTVLGNHDLHMLAVYAGVHKIKDKDKTRPVYDAPDCDELMTWLRQQPLLIHESMPNSQYPGFILTHAGLSPQWDRETAKACASEVESVLKSDDWQWLIREMYANEPAQWSPSLKGINRYRYIINALTRMRFCFPDASLDMDCKLPPEQVTDGSLEPWFKLPGRMPVEECLVFGHWAALGGTLDNGLAGLDTGCVWGGSLTMLRWEDMALFSLPCPADKRK